jgi:hypothetical protein
MGIPCRAEPFCFRRMEWYSKTVLDVERVQTSHMHVHLLIRLGNCRQYLHEYEFLPNSELPLLLGKRKEGRTSTNRNYAEVLFFLTCDAPFRTGNFPLPFVCFDHFGISSLVG